MSEDSNGGCLGKEGRSRAFLLKKSAGSVPYDRASVEEVRSAAGYADAPTTRLSNGSRYNPEKSVSFINCVVRAAMSLYRKVGNPASRLGISAHTIARAGKISRIAWKRGRMYFCFHCWA